MVTSSALPSFVDLPIARSAQAVLDGLRLYHRHTVDGLQHIPRAGAGLLVVNHSLATYDILLLGYAVLEDTGRVVRALADRLIFKIPPLARLSEGLGAVQGEQATAQKLLQAGELVMVAPGGMREALRPSPARYQTSWQGRLGFARLAIRTQTPVILAACPAADDVYTVYDNPVTDFFLRRFHVPLPLARGLGPSWVPRPVRLKHYVHPPLTPPPVAESDTAAVIAFQAQLEAAMDTLLRTPS